MAKFFALMVLLARLLFINGEELPSIDNSQFRTDDKGAQSYSFGYGVTDTQTGDVKTIWESKEGDTVKGHYSMLEPDGSVRTVEYSASPRKGFTAEVNNEAATSQETTKVPEIEDKSYRDYKKPYEFPEDLEFYSAKEMRNKKRQYDSFYKDYPKFRKPTFSYDTESEYPYDLPTKHIQDDVYGKESYSHVGFPHDANCKTKHTNDKGHFHKNAEDLDFRKHKNPFRYTETYNYDKYRDSHDDNADKYNQRQRLKGQHNLPRPDELGLPSSLKYSYPVLPDVPPSESFYHDEIVQRPRKKHRPNKNSDSYNSNDDLNDYVLVPKKKFMKPPRLPDISDYPPEIEDYYDNSEEDDDRNQKPLRGSAQKEVVRKIVKKRKPSIINLLDILDI